MLGGLGLFFTFVTVVALLLQVRAANRSALVGAQPDVMSWLISIDESFMQNPDVHDRLFPTLKPQGVDTRTFVAALMCLNLLDLVLEMKNHFPKTAQPVWEKFAVDWLKRSPLMLELSVTQREWWAKGLARVSQQATEEMARNRIDSPAKVPSDH
jgi:hypothetical protein